MREDTNGKTKFKKRRWIISKLLSPFLKETKLENFEVFVVADEVRYFGRVGDLG